MNDAQVYSLKPEQSILYWYLETVHFDLSNTGMYLSLRIEEMSCMLLLLQDMNRSILDIAIFRSAKEWWAICRIVVNPLFDTREK